MAFEYEALLVKPVNVDSRAPVVATFVAPVGEILAWTTIERLATTGGGHQRIKNESKVRAIKRFLELDPRNTIPTALTVAIRGADCLIIEGGVTMIRISDEDPPRGIVIDGQHRLFGMASFDAAMETPVVALIDPSDDEIAFQFLVINNKVTKVSTDHLKLLSLHFGEDELRTRLRSARMVLSKNTNFVGVVDTAEDSPFFGRVLWPTQDRMDAVAPGEEPLVLPAAIEQAVAAISQKGLPDLADDDALTEFFFVLWRCASQRWPDQWNPDSKLLSKVGVVALTTFVIDNLTPFADKGDLDLSDPERVKAEIDELLADVDERFWKVEWAAKSLDTMAGRQLVVDALLQVRRNVRREVPWAYEVDLVTDPGE